jgi:hypothetical protein
MPDLLLACVPCQSTVTVNYDGGRDQPPMEELLAEHGTCYRCQQPMVETERGDCGHILVPGEDCSCDAALRMGNGAP